jgi:hypothetical protein
MKNWIKSVRYGTVVYGYANYEIVQHGKRYIAYVSGTYVGAYSSLGAAKNRLVGVRTDKAWIKYISK